MNESARYDQDFWDNLSKADKKSLLKALDSRLNDILGDFYDEYERQLFKYMPSIHMLVAELSIFPGGQVDCVINPDDAATYVDDAYDGDSAPEGDNPNKYDLLGNVTGCWSDVSRDIDDAMAELHLNDDPDESESLEDDLIDTLNYAASELADRVVSDLSGEFEYMTDDEEEYVRENIGTGKFDDVIDKWLSKRGVTESLHGRRIKVNGRLYERVSSRRNLR